MSKYYQNSQLQINFLEQMIKLNHIIKSDVILDLGCDKHAPHKVELENLGYNNVYGVDIKPNSKDLNNYIQCDFLRKEFNLKMKAKLIYIFSPCFEDQWWNLDIFLQNVVNNLAKDGVFIFDLFDYNSLELGTTQSNTQRKDNKTIIASTIRNKDCYLLDYKEIITQDGTVVLDSKGIWRIFEELELNLILAKYGLTITDKYVDFTISEGSFEVALVKKRLIVKIEFNN
jgi:hypothetical protein